MQQTIDDFDVVGNYVSGRCPPSVEIIWKSRAGHESIMGLGFREIHRTESGEYFLYEWGNGYGGYRMLKPKCSCAAGPA